ncbi:hypothetical protein ACTSEZ_10035 [Metabacillus sp. JX24]|uniref:hypothetical protein n=1 Tax=Metabacillus sp. JX24 TaxID=3240759 RepID=UPI00350F4E84
MNILKKWKHAVIAFVLISALFAPTSALASGYNYSQPQQNSFDSFLDSVFSYFFGDKNTKYDYGSSQKNKYEANTVKYDGKYYYCWTKFWWGWGWKKYTKKEWEDCFPQVPKESWEIWKKWYCW